MTNRCVRIPLLSSRLISSRLIRDLHMGFLLVFCLVAAAPSQTAAAGEHDQSPTSARNSGLYMKVELATDPQMSKRKPGDVIDGTLARDVYSSDHKLFSSGDHVRLTVDHLEKRKRTRTDHWPGVVNLFTPRHESYPVFKSTTVVENDKESSLQVSVIAARRMRKVQAQARKSTQTENEHGAVVTGKSNQKQKPPFNMVLEATEPGDLVSPISHGESAPGPTSLPKGTLPIGTRLKVVLLGDASASKSKPGDLIQARLLEPVILNSTIALPAGSLLEGKVLKNMPPRMLSRAGSLYLTFTSLTAPSGSHFQVAASLAGADLDQRSHTKIDAEGQLHGEHPGKAWMAINLGVTAGVGKVADDTLQLIIQLIVSTATDVSTAGAGRIAAGCVSGIYLATRHGRDVVLPRFTEMDLSLDRPLSLDPAHTTEMQGPPAGGK
jgi:hypothetical protein